MQGAAQRAQSREDAGAGRGPGRRGDPDRQRGQRELVLGQQHQGRVERADPRGGRAQRGPALPQSARHAAGRVTGAGRGPRPAADPGQAADQAPAVGGPLRHGQPGRCQPGGASPGGASPAVQPAAAGAAAVSTPAGRRWRWRSAAGRGRWRRAGPGGPRLLLLPPPSAPSAAASRRRRPATASPRRPRTMPRRPPGPARPAPVPHHPIGHGAHAGGDDEVDARRRPGQRARARPLGEQFQVVGVVAAAAAIGAGDARAATLG